MATARYRVIHDTHYPYSHPVSLSEQMLHLIPQPCAWQDVHRLDLAIAPEPSWQIEHADAFGNPTRWLAIYQPHDALHVRLDMDVGVLPRAIPALADSLPWDALVDRLAYHGPQAPLPADLAAARFCFESPHVSIKNELLDYARDCFPPGRPLLEATQALMSQIHRDFIFDPEATTVATPVLEVLANRRGVCQDFAHLMISCLRTLRLPARYMSGYILTHPPPGQPRMIGADASHAWVSVYDPDSPHGWVDFDPTNDLLPNTAHVTLAWGRDFSDVSPLRGIILGGGGHDPKVAVTMLPLDEHGDPLETLVDPHDGDAVDTMPPGESGDDSADTA